MAFTQIGWARDKLLPNVIFDTNSALEWLLWNSSCQIRFGDGQNWAQAQSVQKAHDPIHVTSKRLFRTGVLFSASGAAPGSRSWAPPAAFAKPSLGRCQPASQITLSSVPTLSKELYFPPTCQWTETTTTASADVDSATPLLIESPVTPLPRHRDQVPLDHFKATTSLRIYMHGRRRSISAFSFESFMCKNENTQPSLLALPPSSPMGTLKTAVSKDTQILLDIFPRFLGCRGSSMGISSHFQASNSHRGFQLKRTSLVAKYSD